MEDIIKESINLGDFGDRNGKRWEDYDYIRVPVAKGGTYTAKGGKDEYGEHNLPDGTKYSVIDVGKLLDDQSRAQTVLTHIVPFFGSFTSMLRPVYTFQVETQATDGYNLFINPWFTWNMTLEEKVFVLAHEIMHCVLNHMRRGKALHHDPEKSNIAADYECNDTLADEFKIVSPSVIKHLGALYNQKYDGWGYEKIYADNPPGPSSNPNDNPPTPPKNGRPQPSKSNKPTSGGGGGQINVSDDYKNGWNQAMEDYKNGKLKVN